MSKVVCFGCRYCGVETRRDERFVLLVLGFLGFILSLVGKIGSAIATGTTHVLSRARLRRQDQNFILFFDRSR